MTAEAARILLGVDDDATEVESAAAHRRLIDTVHPDVCRGPEAARLARQGTNARNFLCIGRALESTADDTRADDPVLQAMVVRALAKTDGHAAVATVVSEVFTALRRTRAPERDAWTRRLGETSFWSEGGNLRLWRIHWDRISPTTAEDRRAEPARTPDPAPAQTQPASADQRLKTPGTEKAQQTPGWTRRFTWRHATDSGGRRAATARPTGWIAAVAATGLLTLAALMAAAAIAGAMSERWIDAARYAIFGLIALSSAWSVKRTAQLHRKTFATARVLVPGAAGGLAIA